MSAEDIAILNQVQLNQTIQAGARLKVPREGGDINRERGTSRLRGQPEGRQRISVGTP